MRSHPSVVHDGAPGAHVPHRDRYKPLLRLVAVPDWRPDGDATAGDRPTPLLAAVARKP